LASILSHALTELMTDPCLGALSLGKLDCTLDLFELVFISL